MNRQRFVLPFIVIAQFCCTSLWFAANGVMSALMSDFSLPSSALSDLTSAVQLGFISGTLIFAVLTIADRFPPVRVFFVSALLGALFNLTAIWDGNTYFTLLSGRFLVGIFLAGIYPVGMKIAADYFSEGLGRSLSFLVGALVLGTALPHLLLYTGSSLPWRYVIIATSGLAVFGGMIILLIGDGPYRKKAQRPDLTAFFRIFNNRDLRAASFGYFGHMWELYAFWAFIPVMLGTYKNFHDGSVFSISLWSFLIIALGALACVAGGLLSIKYGSRTIARSSLLLSGIWCIASVPAFMLPPFLFLGFLVIWGMVVIADSPLFSSLVAMTALPEQKGTALTIVTSLGFLITIGSIQLLNQLIQIMDPRYIYLILGLGPLFGLISGRSRKSD